MTEVSITTGARLHFGPLSVNAPAGGRFGGVGVMISSPGFAMTIRPSATDTVSGDPEVADRVSEFLRRIRQSTSQRNQIPCEISIAKSIPSHCGFGSGTQLALAVARAVSIMEQESEPGLEVLAHRVQRGLRSAIGLYGFALGGFLVDGGRVESNQLGTLVARRDFPSEWRFVLGAPRQASGLSGAAEQSAFSKQPPMPVSLTAELCRIVLMDWLPSVIESDYGRCSEAMYGYGHAVGQFFTPAQGGVFANRRMSEWAGLIRSRGIQGVAQTSWGPTLAVLCSCEEDAQQITADFANDPAWEDCHFEIVRPLNGGATVQLL